MDSMSRIGHSTRSKFLKIRVSPEEYQFIKSSASSLDVTMSALCRALLLLPKTTQTKLLDLSEEQTSNKEVLLVFDNQSYRELTTQIRAVGRQINYCLHSLRVVASRKFLSADTTAEYLDKGLVALERADSRYNTVIDELEKLTGIDSVMLDGRY